MVYERVEVIRIAFVFGFDGGWLGGINYFRNLFTALYALPDRRVEAVIFTGYDTPQGYFEDIPVEVVRSRLFDKKSILYWLRSKFLYRLERDLLIEWFFKLHRISILSHSDWLRGKDALPTVGWIPDFQHLHLPEFFSHEEIKSRNIHYHAICEYCSKVIISSYDALKDLKEFDPIGASKAAVLSFVVSPIVEVLLPDRQTLEKRYGFSGEFFLLPNQFWKHKNHLMVIEALGLLAKSGNRVLIICTGNASDYRHPGYSDSLFDRAKALGVDSDFKHLGVIPSSDLAGLMLYSSGIINPSYFEGWSTTVEEAKALGKRILLSDIPVHREQSPARARYFDPNNPVQLARMLWDIYVQPDIKGPECNKLAKQETQLRREKFARQYQNIVLSALEKS